ncbi:MAG: glycosyltransferase family 2 protein [Alphaproteobacteria bacterium]|nr:MAG: glycosyltransferase family 2 protein [Alphaproteobacteria bacterium]
MITPVLFIIFNRPDTTQRVFNEIRKAKPAKLFIAADGTRNDKDGEAEKCQAARDVIKQLDWDCEVKTLFRDKNLGCKVAVSSAIDWFFENVEEGIILEDDCLPHLTFFPFCQELLEKYRDDERIFVISADNFLFGRQRTNYSYHFSYYNHCWGWATWKRAWLYYDREMRFWPEIKNENWLKDILVHSTVIRYWSDIFQTVYEGKIDTWDYQWLFSCWVQNGLTIIPSVNLVSNIGFRADATHTKSLSRNANLNTASMDFPLKHPPFIIRETKADDFVQKTLFHKSSISSRIIDIIGNKVII